MTLKHSYFSEITGGFRLRNELWIFPILRHSQFGCPCLILNGLLGFFFLLFYRQMGNSSEWFLFSKMAFKAGLHLSQTDVMFSCAAVPALPQPEPDCSPAMEKAPGSHLGSKQKICVHLSCSCKNKTVSEDEGGIRAGTHCSPTLCLSVCVRRGTVCEVSPLKNIYGMLLPACFLALFHFVIERKG